jgi:two-component system cell cycle sensor histidine kinase/response regulator CckA
MLRELIRIALEMLGCDVAEAADGRTALQTHRTALEAGTPFSLMISDLSLPGDLSAVETLRQMLQTTPELRALLCTGNTDSDVFRNFHDHGFCGRIPKPFEVADLFKTIQLHLPDHPS